MYNKENTYRKIKRFMINHVYYKLESVKVASNKAAKKFGCTRGAAAKIIQTEGW